MIEIRPYQAAWPREFAAAGQRIRRALGDLAVAIHHIGSTSVPGLAAKDIIDIQLTVADLDGPYPEALHGIGFELGEPRCDHCPPGMSLAAEDLAKRFFKYRDRPTHLHVRAVGRFNQRYALLFRDYLRAVPLAAQAYEAVKHQLAHYFPTDRTAYCEVKDPVCDALMIGASAWAQQTSWLPGPSEA